ncbi:metallophosphoesterase [Actinosynnema sp. NPDC020468]|uniref:metallophosphoesterase n=1 Tax=Actinosynnema sp. NPDC020468 TaxID=3154488 RepID=UPI0033C634A5
MFVLLFAAVLGGVHYYLWRRLVRDTTRTRRARRVGTVVLVALYALMLAALSLTRVSFAAGSVVAWPGYLWLALAFYLALALAVLEVPRVLLQRRTAPEDPDRRRFIARSIAVAGGVAATGVVGYGMTEALGEPRLKRVPIVLPKLDPKLTGYRIAVVSDIHLGPLLGRAHTERIVRLINGVEADLVAIVGDLVDGTVEELGEAAAPLRDLVSTHGSFFVTGNHEYYSGAQPWLAELERLGVHPLRNERVAVERAGARFDLAGVNDVTGAGFADGPDFAKALDGRDASRPVVLLAHQPVQAHEAARHGVDLQLSGHTHGGQMFPFHLAVGLQQPVRSGLATVDGMPVYVSNGAGFWGPPVRVGAPPDVTVVELRHKLAAG